MALTETSIRGAMYGLLVGDAVGVPYEFHSADEIPSYHEIEMGPPAGFRRAHADVQPGTWSDDGAQALLLLDSLMTCGRFDADDFGERLVRWYNEGYLAVDQKVFDVGVTTGKAITSIQCGTPAIVAGPGGVYDNGNGSLMRSLPLALWHTGTDDDLVSDARKQSRVTHGHLRSQICCALYCLWARRIATGGSAAWASAVDTLENMFSVDSPERSELDFNIRPRLPPEGSGSGYVVDSLRSARQALLEPSFEAVVKTAVSFGNDTDTTACIAGGIAGLRSGLTGIPQRWLDSLRGRSVADVLIDDLVHVRLG